MYFDYKMAADKRLTGKELMLKWCPDGARVKSRMTFASSSKGLTDALNVSFILSILGLLGSTVRLHQGLLGFPALLKM